MKRGQNLAYGAYALTHEQADLVAKTLKDRDITAEVDPHPRHYLIFCRNELAERVEALVEELVPGVDVTNSQSGTPS